MNISDLKPFCGVDETRPALLQPFTDGEWTYFTDGRIAVRVAAILEIPHRSEAPNEKISGIFRNEFYQGDFKPLPAFKEVTCDYCDGQGKCKKTECPDCESSIPLDVDVTCSRCAGLKVVFDREERTFGVPFGSQMVNPLYLKKLSQLPGVKLANGKMGANALPFIFDGGCGLLMPMRK